MSEILQLHGPFHVEKYDRKLELLLLEVRKAGHVKEDNKTTTTLTGVAVLPLDFIFFSKRYALYACPRQPTLPLRDYQNIATAGQVAQSINAAKVVLV